jgi:hypothetical protein
MFKDRPKTYEEWIEVLKRERNVQVSILYKNKSIEQRIIIDESRDYQIPQSIRINREMGILFGIKNLISKFNGMTRIPILSGKKIK